ncbi:hypothetical protein [Martelella alba]|uniref:hypothetical protein n=1 Tax=Martelella alba TaxID=2590451 RepID=UPI0015E83EDD|nr:hypothetical protein [Martelella alba]
MTHRHPLTAADCRFMARLALAFIVPLSAFAIVLLIHQLFALEAALAAAAGV